MAEGDDCRDHCLQQNRQSICSSLKNPYRIEELKYIRQRISELSSNIKDIELYYIGAVGALYAFMFVNSEKISYTAAIFAAVLPVFISIYAGIKIRMIFKAIRIHDEYIEKYIDPRLGGGFIRYYYSRYCDFSIPDQADLLNYRYFTNRTPDHMMLRYMFWNVSSLIAFGMLYYVVYFWSKPNSAILIKISIGS